MAFFWSREGQRDDARQEWSSLGKAEVDFGEGQWIKGEGRLCASTALNASTKCGWYGIILKAKFQNQFSVICGRVDETGW